MKRHIPGRHRAPLNLPRPMTGTATVAASGLLLAAFGASSVAAPELPATTFGASSPAPFRAWDSAQRLSSPDESATGGYAKATSVTSERPAQAVPAPAKEDVEHRHFGELGFTGITPLEPEPMPLEVASELSSPASEDVGDATASASQGRVETNSASRSQPRPEAPPAAAHDAEPESQAEPAPEPAPQPEPALPMDTPATGGQGAEAAIAWAQSNLGLPYSWGSSTGGAYDCSGFTTAAFRAAGISIPHQSEAQYHATSRVPLSEMRRGDLLFYSTNGAASGIFHVAIYLGDGQVIHSLRDWSSWDGSKVSGLNYASGLMAAGRP